MCSTASHVASEMFFKNNRCQTQFKLKLYNSTPYITHELSKEERFIHKQEQWI